ncbi:MAG: hypothetical protein ACRC46_11810 [Thermoguttaceae bacterium]
MLTTEENIQIISEEIRLLTAAYREQELRELRWAAERDEREAKYAAERDEREAKYVAERIRYAAEQAERDAKYAAERTARDREWNKKVNRLDDNWGRLVEAFVNNQIVKLLQSIGIAVQRTVRNVKDDSIRHYEYDIIAINGDTIVIFEVKTTLNPADVDYFLMKLRQAREWLPEYRDKVILGGVAYLHDRKDAVKLAQEAGLITCIAAGASAAITSPAGFQPKHW